MPQIYVDIKQEKEKQLIDLYRFKKNVENKFSIGNLVRFRAKGTKDTELRPGVIVHIETPEISFRDLNTEKLITRHVNSVFL